MHSSVKEWIGSRVAEYGLCGRSCLDVGARDVNGSVRSLFDGAYFGIDMRSGAGVDGVADASFLPFTDGAFWTVVAAEMLEHCEHPWAAVEEMGRVAQKCVLVTTRSPGFPVHYPPDYWRFTVKTLTEIFARTKLFKCTMVDFDPQFPGVFAIGVKNG